MKAGFARADITPPLGTPMMGYGDTGSRPAESVHDPLYARVLSLSHGVEQALIISLDLCFIGREESDQIKAILGRELELLPRQILISATHNHAGPACGDYLDLEYAPVQRDYQRDMCDAILRAARAATAARRDVTLEAGMGKSTLPVNRRQRRPEGIHNAPNPGGPVLDSLPVCLLKDSDGRPVCLLFGVSTHVVCMRDRALSADYPGLACDLLDKKLGVTCSMFLQGVGGDSRPLPCSMGKDWNWHSNWTQAEACGQLLAREVEATLAKGLTAITPTLRSALVDTAWPLDSLPREKYAEAAADRRGAAGEILPPSYYQKWARRWLALFDQGRVPKTISVLIQGIQMGQGLRLVAIEGEPLCPHGMAIEQQWPVPASGGATFALGYANGEAMYLVSTPMLDEGGYEPISYWEYGQPAPLAPGLESARDEGFRRLMAQGIA